MIGWTVEWSFKVLPGFKLAATKGNALLSQCRLAPSAARTHCIIRLHKDDPHNNKHTLVDYLICFVFLSPEVTLKVHLSDASTRRPLGGATIELFSNHTSVAVETSAAEGNAYLRFPYRLGTLLVVTATKQGYVPRSAPWTPSRLPGECVSCSLSLLFSMSMFH